MSGSDSSLQFGEKLWVPLSNYGSKNMCDTIDPNLDMKEHPGNCKGIDITDITQLIPDEVPISESADAFLNTNNSMEDAVEKIEEDKIAEVKHLDDDPKVELIKSLVNGAIDALEGEHSIKMRKASIMIILASLYTQSHIVLPLIDSTMGLKYFLDEWLIESDYTTLRWADRKIWILGLLGLIKITDDRPKAITDIAERIMTTLLALFTEKLQYSDEFECEDSNYYVDTSDDENYYIDIGDENISTEMSDTQTNQASKETAIIEMAEQIKKHSDQVLHPSIHLQQSTAQVLDGIGNKQGELPEISVTKSDEVNEMQTNNAVHVEDRENGPLDETEKIDDEYKPEDGNSVDIQLRKEDVNTDVNYKDDDTLADSDEANSTDSTSTAASYDTDSELDSIYESYLSNVLDPSLYKYYRALDGVNICSCCLPAAFLRTMTDCLECDYDWYKKLTDNLSAEAISDLEKLKEFGRERELIIADAAAEHAAQKAAYHAEINQEDFHQMSERSNDSEQIDVLNNSSHQEKKDETEAEECLMSDDQNTSLGNSWSTVNTDSTDGSEEDDPRDTQPCIFSPAPAIHVVTKYFKYLKLNESISSDNVK